MSEPITLEEAFERIEYVLRSSENVANASPFHDASSRRSVAALVEYVRSEMAAILKANG